MAEQGYTLLAEDLRRIGRCVTDYERGKRTAALSGRPERFQPPGRPPIVGILLDDLDSGQTVEVAVLEDVTSNETQVITIYGSSSGGYFRLGFQPSASAPVEWTAHIDPNSDDAAKVATYLEALPSVSPGDVVVSFGIVTTSDGIAHKVYRWSVTFRGQFEGQDVQPLQVDDHLSGAGLLVESTSVLEDAGWVETVREGLGVGYPTPLKAGARILAHWVHGIGYVVGSVEARDFGDYDIW